MTIAATVILAGPGEFLPVIFVLYIIARGIINFIKEQKQSEQVIMARRGDSDVDPEPQSEIDAFLEEVSPGDSDVSRRSRQSDPQQRRRKRTGASEEEAERRRRVRARREHEKRQREEEQSRQTLRKRHLETSELGEVSDRHVESSVEDRHLQAHIDGLPVNKLREHSIVEVPTADIAALDATSVAVMLQTSGGVRNAILLSEIVGPPLGSRPRRNR
jgi:hypothetical protein